MLGTLKPNRQSRPQRGRRATTARACRRNKAGESAPPRRDRQRDSGAAPRGAGAGRSHDPRTPSRLPIGAALVAAGRRHRRPRPRKQRRAAAQACRSGSLKHAQGDGSKRAGILKNPDKKSPSERGKTLEGAALYPYLDTIEARAIPKSPSLHPMKSRCFNGFRVFYHGS